MCDLAALSSNLCWQQCLNIPELLHTCTLCIYTPLKLFNIYSSRRISYILSIIYTRYSTKAGVALVENGIDALQECDSQSVKRQIAAGLDTAVHKSWSYLSYELVTIMMSIISSL